MMMMMLIMFRIDKRIDGSEECSDGRDASVGDWRVMVDASVGDWCVMVDASVDDWCVMAETPVLVIGV